MLENENSPIAVGTGGAPSSQVGGLSVGGQLGAGGGGGGDVDGGGTSNCSHSGARYRSRPGGRSGGGGDRVDVDHRAVGQGGAGAATAAPDVGAQVAGLKVVRLLLVARS